MNKLIVLLALIILSLPVNAKTFTFVQSPSSSHNFNCNHPNYNNYNKEQLRRVHREMRKNYYNGYNGYNNAYYDPYYNNQYTTYPKSNNFWTNFKNTLIQNGSATGLSPVIPSGNDWGYVEQIEDANGNYYKIFKQRNTGAGVQILD